MGRLLASLCVGLLATACAQAATPDKQFNPNGGGAGSSAGGSTNSGGTSSGGSSGTSGGATGGTSSGGSSGTSGNGGSSGTGGTSGNGGSSGTGGTSGSGGSSGTGGTSGSGGSTNMDPGLALPDPNGTPRTHPGTSTGCSNLEVCRIYNGNSGRCETCDNCGNLYAYCDTNRDCDILFQCYQHKCTNICPLGTSYCGPVKDCLDVGNSTYGVCKPY